jgi:hypothetical protein
MLCLKSGTCILFLKISVKYGLIVSMSVNPTTKYGTSYNNLTTWVYILLVPCMFSVYVSSVLIQCDI